MFLLLSSLLLPCSPPRLHRHLGACTFKQTLQQWRGQWRRIKGNGIRRIR
ncbi:hypothetical protein E2C01_091569 [Portunus trituberculatus]|uniref:Uncharacterized protein n=1 Tax=Portunus trituberculatus TaxID=210409 RepID=A0A5B7JT77_PORTR|nr:hypothetical protein [Portunus trituberculatus]